MSKQSQDSVSDPSQLNQKPQRTPVLYLLLVLLGAGGTIATDRWLAASSVAQPQPTVSPSLVSFATPINPSNDGSNPNFIETAVDQVGEAVVRIDSQRTVNTRSSRTGDRLRNSMAPSQIEQGTGSGFIVDANGLILTNAHVIDKADQVTVSLKDGRTFDGEVLGTDPLTDVAVVKIQATNLPIVELGNSDQVKPGEWAIAIGNPLGLDNTVTAGIVSGTDRSSAQVGIPDRRIGFIQTDAAINPGNSGGPLLNAAGEVIGMNTAIIGGAQGLGFAIPINTAKRIADELVATGEVEHAYLGIQMATITPQLKQRLDGAANSPITITDDQGVVVVDVVANSPAAQAGLQAGDVIRQINGQSVTTSEQLLDAVEASQVGESLQVELNRNGRSQTVAIQLAAFPVER